MVSSKYKQLYECRLPAQAVRFHQDPASEPDSQGYTGPDIPDLLSPMHNAQCLVKVSSQLFLCVIQLVKYCLETDLNLYPAKAELFSDAVT